MMLEEKSTTERIRGYCALCTSRCGSIALIKDGRFIALEPDPTHPTGKALCAKGRAAPELVYHPDRLLYPLKRTRPKTDPDPGWQRIDWDEALDLVSANLRRIAQAHGPESIVFSVVSPSTSASDDSVVWIQRLRNAMGSPNLCLSMELCAWGRYGATQYTFGAAVPGDYMPDLEHAGCILFWGYNPNLARLSHATATIEALKRGARLIVVDPRRTGVAKKAHVWLQVRPGTDAALALGVAHLMIERGWYDHEFVRDWTNAPLLVRSDTGRLLRASDITGDNRTTGYVAWHASLHRPIFYDPASGRTEGEHAESALAGACGVETAQGVVACRPVFDLVIEHCRRYPPDRVEAICGVEQKLVEETAQMLWEARPVAYYAWSGVEMQTNATQIARAIAQIYALTGSLDAMGGNVLFPSVPAASAGGFELLSRTQRDKTLGLAERPLGPSRWGYVTTDELYRAILEQRPYGVHALVGFGANLLLAHADSRRGREALTGLDFYVHADVFMNPTAELADVVLPVATPFEREALKLGFEISAEAQSSIQFRQPVVPAQGEARSDTQIVFDLATRLGLGALFWDGSVEDGYRFQLSPSGVSLEELVSRQGTVRLTLPMQYRKFAKEEAGTQRGFDTPSRKVELYSETMLEQGYAPLPEFEEPLVGPNTRQDLANRFPLILTCAKHYLFCETQHRGLPSLRRKAMDPDVELHPDTAAERGIHEGDWVRVETPNGSIRARARLDATLKRDVVCGQHGWWQACPEVGAPGYDPFSDQGSNFNLIIGNEAIDPISGSVPHRAYLCQVHALT